MVRLMLLLFVGCLLIGCARAERYFRLEEWGEGWRLEVEEAEGRRFAAKWVAGDNRSARIVNIHDADRPGFTVVNTLYLEIGERGEVADGWLKRFVVRDIRAPGAEDGATWWRVLEGYCRLDEYGYGTLHVRCQGNYTFMGDVIPMDGLEVRRPE
jgi:hypothetical protein